MRSFLVCVLALFLGHVAQAQSGAPPMPARAPNIVLILADDLGFECIGASGGTSYATPRIDRLAREGVWLTECHATPLCTPSRVQLMTGKYSFRNYERFGYLNPDEETFADRLKSAGYATGIFGKWQLHYGAAPDPSVPKRFGFDEWCLWNSQWEPPASPGSRYSSPRLDFNGEVRVVDDAYGPDVISERALDFVKRHRDEPFLLYYPMVLPHSPFVPTPASPEGRKRGAECYGDMVTYMDTLVGRLVDALAELEVDQRTLVLFVGDNGTPRGIRSMWRGEGVAGGKALMNTAGTHVPCVAHWPGTIEPRALDDLVDFTDFLPTMLEAASIATAPGTNLDGRSFLPQLLGEPGSPREWVFCHYDPRWNVPGKPGRSVFDGRFRLHGDGRLFDLERARYGTEPLAVIEGTAEPARMRLQAVLDAMPPWDPPSKAERDPVK